MRFAEVTQEVMVDRPETVKKQVGLAPGRHRGNNNYLVYIHMYNNAFTKQNFTTSSQFFVDEFLSYSQLIFYTNKL